MTQVQWQFLTPPEFKKLAKEEKVCILPIGSLERHGEHMPFGTDGLTAHTVSVLAAEKEHCVVFPPYWFGQLHEASCFAGTINFPMDLLLKMLETLLDQIAQNGFEKILIVNGHGGNDHFLDYFMMSQLDREVPYTLYKAFVTHGPRVKALDIWESKAGGHADEKETSMIMAIAPGTVKLEQQKFQEPILPGDRLQHLRDNGIHTGLWWYGLYPEHVSGSPSFASEEKGKQFLAAAAEDMADVIRTVKKDTAAPEAQKEFYRRHKEVRENK